MRDKIWLSVRSKLPETGKRLTNRDLRMLQIYYNESGEDLAKMLD